MPLDNITDFGDDVLRVEEELAGQAGDHRVRHTGQSHGGRGVLARGQGRGGRGANGGGDHDGSGSEDLGGEHCDCYESRGGCLLKMCY